MSNISGPVSTAGAVTDESQRYLISIKSALNQLLANQSSSPPPSPPVSSTCYPYSEPNCTYCLTNNCPNPNETIIDQTICYPYSEPDCTYCLTNGCPNPNGTTPTPTPTPSCSSTNQINCPDCGDALDNIFARYGTNATNERSFLISLCNYRAQNDSIYAEWIRNGVAWWFGNYSPSDVVVYQSTGWETTPERVLPRWWWIYPEIPRPSLGWLVSRNPDGTRRRDTHLPPNKYSISILDRINLNDSTLNGTIKNTYGTFRSSLSMLETISDDIINDLNALFLGETIPVYNDIIVYETFNNIKKNNINGIDKHDKTKRTLGRGKQTFAAMKNIVEKYVNNKKYDNRKNNIETFDPIINATDQDRLFEAIVDYILMPNFLLNEESCNYLVSLLRNASYDVSRALPSPERMTRLCRACRQLDDSNSINASELRVVCFMRTLFDVVYQEWVSRNRAWWFGLYKAKDSNSNSQISNNILITGWESSPDIYPLPRFWWRYTEIPAPSINFLINGDNREYYLPPSESIRGYSGRIIGFERFLIAKVNLNKATNWQSEFEKDDLWEVFFDFPDDIFYSLMACQVVPRTIPIYSPDPVEANTPGFTSVIYQGTIIGTYSDVVYPPSPNARDFLPDDSTVSKICDPTLPPGAIPESLRQMMMMPIEPFTQSSDTVTGVDWSWLIVIIIIIIIIVIIYFIFFKK